MAMRNDLSAEIKSDLINYNGAVQGTAYIVLGDTVLADSNLRFYYYSSTSTATPDGEFVLAATGMGGTGRFIKIQAAGAGTGITFNATSAVITNSSPDQTVALANGTGISISGTYPNFTITNASPNQTVSITAGTGISVTGSYPNFTVTNTSSTTRTTSTLSLSLVGTGATGTQISSTKDSTVRCTVSTSTTSTIGGPATSVVALKICSTNNATEGSWTTVATFESDQNITLAVALQSVQVVKGQLCADVPSGFYVKLVNSGTGTHAESFLSGQQTIYG